jgi:DNA gyrase subunit A
LQGAESKLSQCTRIIEKSDLEADERPIYIMGTKNYSGYLIVGFDNGKVGKISMNSYQTEFNRKKLKGAFNTESRLIFIEYITKDTDFTVLSSIKKVIVFNTVQINAVSSRNTKGVQVMKSKDRSLMARMKRLDSVHFADPDYYRNENLNVVGYYLKDGDEF